MSALKRFHRRPSLALVVGSIFLAGGSACAQPPADPGQGAKSAFTVDGRMALHSFVTLGDGHMRKFAEVFELLAATDAVRSGEWERIRGPLASVAPMTVPAALWFAQPNGNYSTVQQGHAGNLSDRAYFPHVLAGEIVVGTLVVSRSTHRNTAIVAVPVRGSDNEIVGVLGASVHLDSLGALIREELGGLDTHQLFFAIDSTPMGAIHSDPGLIFTEPMKLGDEGMRNAFKEMLSRSEGTVTYSFRGAPRTLLYRRSPVTGWWYAFGVVGG